MHLNPSEHAKLRFPDDQGQAGLLQSWFAQITPLLGALSFRLGSTQLSASWQTKNPIKILPKGSKELIWECTPHRASCVLDINYKILTRKSSQALKSLLLPGLWWERGLQHLRARKRPTHRARTRCHPRPFSNTHSLQHRYTKRLHLLTRLQQRDCNLQ